MLRCEGGRPVTSRPSIRMRPPSARLEAGDQAKRRRLAAARRAEQHVERAFVERERKPVDGAHVAVGGRPVLADVFGGDGRHEALPEVAADDITVRRRVVTGTAAPVGLMTRRPKSAALPSTPGVRRTAPRAPRPDPSRA